MSLHVITYPVTAYLHTVLYGYGHNHGDNACDASKEKVNKIITKLNVYKIYHYRQSSDVIKWNKLQILHKYDQAENGFKQNKK